MVVPRGTAAPVLLKWFFSRDVPIGAPSSNGNSYAPWTEQKVESWSEQAAPFYYQTKFGEAHPKLELETPYF
ncbi:unnamed protein product, partial [Dovyalis caffra]